MTTYTQAPIIPVSTHSRPKAAGYRPDLCILDDIEFQLTAARRRLAALLIVANQYKLFQLTAARRRLADGWQLEAGLNEFQLTAARRRLAAPPIIKFAMFAFQLTAARRRLGRILHVRR